MFRIQFYALIVCVFALHSVGFAVPMGYITYGLRTTAAENEIREVALMGGTQEVRVVYNASHIYTINAAPFLGDLCVISMRSSSVYRIELLNRNGSIDSTVLADNGKRAIYPGMSFYGDRIVYVDVDTDLLNDELRTIGSNGQGGHIVFTNNYSGSLDPAQENPTIMDPRFSPDGKTIIFTLYEDPILPPGVYTVPAAGGAAHKLTNLHNYTQHPSYSPNGRWLVCMAWAGKRKAHVANADGSDLRTVDVNDEEAYYVCFSPDSKYIAVCTTSGLQIVDLSTDSVVQHVPVDNLLSYYNLTWHMGASMGQGVVQKAKVNPKKLKLRVVGFAPTASPIAGIMVFDKAIMTLDDAALWHNKKDKRYNYKNKADKRRAKIVIKKDLGSFSVKGLSLFPGTDYRTGTNIPVIVNAGNITIFDSITLNAKGKYKAPK